MFSFFFFFLPLFSQELFRGPHQSHPLHSQRALAVLGALVQRGVISLLGGPACPPKGALPHLVNGKDSSHTVVLYKSFGFTFCF